MMNKHESDENYGAYVQALGRKKDWKAAYEALFSAGPDAVPAILEGMKHEDWRVRRWCAAFLDHHADERCVVALVDALHDESADVRRHAVHGIGCQACKAEPLGIDVVSLLADRALNDASLRVRQVAAHMLGNQPADPRALAALRAILAQESDAKLRSNAAWAASRHAGEFGAAATACPYDKNVLAED